MDKISIITTFYNASEFICNAVNSVLVQEVDTKKFTIEYVLVNDKTPDNSLELVNNFIKKHPAKGIECKVIEPEENLGCGGARRYGIEHATGNYFMFLDADDYYINRDFVLRAYKDIVSNKADIVEYGIVFNTRDGKKNNSCVSRETVITDKYKAELALFRDNMIKFNVWTKIYKREIIESYRYSDSRTFEDVRTVPVWVFNSKKIVIMPSIEINYRAASGSIIRDNWVNTRLGTITAIAEHFERFKDNKTVLKAMYERAMIDLEALLHNHSSENDGFNEMSKLNTYMLKYIYPDRYKEITYNIDE